MKKELEILSQELREMQRLVSHQKEITTGLYFERYAPYRPVLRQRFQLDRSGALL